MNLDQKRIVVTGAASGIGRALVQALSGYDAVQIVAADRDDIGLQETVAAIDEGSARVLAFPCDLSFPQDVDDLFVFAQDQMGGIDLFFANAGFGYYGQIEQADWRRMEEIYRTNVLSPIYAVEKMGELSRDAEYRVVITASILGRMALRGYALYASTKAALDRFAEGYRLEGKDRGSLALVYPVAVRTNFFRTAGDPITPRPSQSAEQAAQAILRGVEEDKQTIYTSWILPPILLVLRILPFTGRLYQWLDSAVVRR